MASIQTDLKSTFLTTSPDVSVASSDAQPESPKGIGRVRTSLFDRHPQRPRQPGRTGVRSENSVVVSTYWQLGRRRAQREPRRVNLRGVRRRRGPARTGAKAMVRG